MSATKVNNEFFDDFIDSTVVVLATMASIEVTGSKVREVDGSSNGIDITSCLDITGILGFSGGRRGSLLVTFPQTISLKAVGGMLGMEFTEIDSDVTDGVGELVNMIAGGIKTKLQAKGTDFQLSIPNTIVGPSHHITAPGSTTRTRIDFETDLGNFFIEVYLKED